MSDDQNDTDPNAPDAMLEEQLVAYLDHELTAESTRQVEERLARDPEIRKRLARLERPWEALEQLETSDIEDSLTQSTLKMIAVAEEEIRELSTESPWYCHRQRLTGVIALGVSALVGFLAVVLFRADPNRQLLENLALIENLDAYRQIDDVEFLRLLHAKGLFAKKVERSKKKHSRSGATGTVRPQSQHQRSHTIGLSSSLVKRLAWVENLAPEEKEPLRRRFERFVGLEPKEHQRLSRLFESVLAEPNARALHSVACRYYEWLKTLEPYQIYQLRDLPPTERVSRVTHLTHEQARRKAEMAHTRQIPRIDRIMKAFQAPGLKIPNGMRPPDRTDVKGLLGWLDTYVENHAPQFLKSLPQPRQELAQQWLSRMNDPVRRRELHGQMLMRWQVNNPGKLPPITEEELAELRAKVSSETRIRLEAMPVDRQWQQVLGWVRIVAAQHFITRRLNTGIEVISNEELADFLEDKLRPEQRDLLLGLPPDELRRELLEMLLRNQGRRSPGGRAPHGRGPGTKRHPTKPRPGFPPGKMLEFGPGSR